MVRRRIGGLLLLAGLTGPAWGKIADRVDGENASWGEGRTEEAGRQRVAELESMSRMDMGEEKEHEPNAQPIAHTTPVNYQKEIVPNWLETLGNLPNYQNPKGSTSTTGRQTQTKKQPAAPYASTTHKAPSSSGHMPSNSGHRQTTVKKTPTTQGGGQTSSLAPGQGAYNVIAGNASPPAVLGNPYSNGTNW